MGFLGELVSLWLSADTHNRVQNQGRGVWGAGLCDKLPKVACNQARCFYVK